MAGDIVLIQNLFEFRQSGSNLVEVLEGEFRGLSRELQLYTNPEHPDVSIGRNLFGGESSSNSATTPTGMLH